MFICILSRMLTFASGWTIPEAIAQTFALVIQGHRLLVVSVLLCQSCVGENAGGDRVLSRNSQS